MDEASWILGVIQYAQQTAPEKSKLLVYTSFCRLIMEYVDVLWDPTDKQSNDSLEKIHSKGARFIIRLGDLE